MAERKQSGGGRRRRKGGDEGPDLFAQHLAEVVQKAFDETADGKAGEGRDAGSLPLPVADGLGPPEVEARVAPAEEAGLPELAEADLKAAPATTEAAPDAEEDEAPKVEAPVEPIQARMMNEFVYCPRLFYYEFVDRVFVESADTLRGAAVHKRVDKGASAIPKGSSEAAEGTREGTGRASSVSPDAAGVPLGASTTPDGTSADISGSPAGGNEEPETKNPPADAEGEVIHRHSVTLGSERLGVIAKMDLVYVTLDDAGGVAAVCPVDYKAGSPREGAAGLELWDTDRMQLGLQCLILCDNGYACQAGLIYYRGTKQKVPLELTPELEAWVGEQIAAARVVARGPIPPPLIDSPKCKRCSLAPVCLPDETRMLSIPTIENYPIGGAGEGASGVSVSTSPEPSDAAAPACRLMAQRDQRRALYLNTPGLRIGCNDAVLKVKEKERVVDEVRISDVCHVALFGNIQISTQAVQRLCDCDIPVTYFSMGGWFYGMTRGHSLTNVLLRIEQFRQAADPACCLRLAQQFVRGKIHNHRVMFMRNHEQSTQRVRQRLGQARDDALAAKSLETLLGVEGAAAAEYFRQFSGLICDENDDAAPEESKPPAAAGGAATARFRFDFSTRNRRPPTDPVNALLSLAYSLLAKECTLAACAVGLDPYVGFYHQPRHGRPALALDVMEEFRPLIAESAVVTAINNRFVSTKDFVTAGQAVNLNPAGRKHFFQCFEQRMTAVIAHPVFGYKVTYRRALELQFRILARVLMGEVPEYVPFLSR